MSVLVSGVKRRRGLHALSSAEIVLTKEVGPATGPSGHAYADLRAAIWRFLGQMPYRLRKARLK